MTTLGRRVVIVFMNHLWFPYTLQAVLFDKLRDACQPRSHVRGQGLDPCVNGFVQGLDRPAHALQPVF